MTPSYEAAGRRTLTKEEKRRYYLYAIMMMMVTIFSGFVVMLHRNSSGVLREFLLNDFSMSALEFSTFSSMYFYPYVIMQLPMGILADTLGPRKTISLGLVICAIGTLLFCNAQSYGMLCISRAIIGVGVSCPVTCTSKLYYSWFTSNRVATMSGIGQGFGSLLSMAGQAPLAIIVGIFSWRSTYMAMALGTIAIAAVIFLMAKDEPQDANLPSMAELDGRPVSPKGAKVSVLTALKNVFCNKYTWPFLLIMPVHMGTYNMFTATWGIPYISDTFSMSTVEASAFTSLILLGQTIGSVIFTWLSDVLKSRKKVVVLITIESIVVWFMLTNCPGLIAKYNLLGPLMIGLGLTQGTIPLFFAWLRELNDPMTAGIATGGPNMIGMAGSALMPVIAGAMIDSQLAQGIQGNMLYHKAFALCTVLYVAALIIVLFGKESGCKNIYHK